MDPPAVEKLVEKKDGKKGKEKKKYWAKKKGGGWTVLDCNVKNFNTKYCVKQFKGKHIFIKSRKYAKFCRPFDSPIYMFPALEKQKTGGLWKERGYS